MIKLVIFDLDGTLLNTLDDLAHCTNYVLKKYNYPVHEVSLYRRMVGNGIDKLLERALPEDARSEGILREVKKTFMAYYAHHKSDQTRPYPGIEALLDELQHKGFVLAVASNKEHESACAMVNHYFKEGTFKMVRGKRDHFPLKPDPAIVYDIMEEAGVEKKEVLYIGDSSIDMQTARNSGVKGVGVSWGFRSVEELKQNGADYIVHQPSGILDVVLSIQ